MYVKQNNRWLAFSIYSNLPVSEFELVLAQRSDRFVSLSVVPSLLCCLSSPVREVRRAALGALRGLSGARSSPFKPITEKLLKTSEEIVADPSYLSTALGVLHQSSEKKLQLLLQSVVAPHCPSYTAANLLRALSHVTGPVSKRH